MRRTLNFHVALIPSILVLLAVGCSPRTGAEYVRSVDQWHEQRIARLLDESGWLTLIGLHPLSQGENRVGSDAGMDVRIEAPVPGRLGVLTVSDNGIVFVPEPGSGVRTTDADSEASGPVPMLADADGSPTVLRSGSVSFHVIARGDLLFLRVRDGESPVRRNFRGIERYPVDARWRVTARIEPRDPPRGVPVPNVLGQIDREPSCGDLVFELAGRRCRLTPIGEAGEPLFVVFSDLSSGDETYGGGRFLSTDPPAADGTVVLDFNKAVNPPCVFTDFATCPLPPEGNALPLAVQAGERMWGEAH